jgi:hypothetical protein
MVKGEHIFIVYAITMTIIISTDINNILRTNSSRERSENSSVIDNNIWPIISPNYCTTCHGGGCCRCTPSN